MKNLMLTAIFGIYFLSAISYGQTTAPIIPEDTNPPIPIIRIVIPLNEPMLPVIPDPIPKPQPIEVPGIEKPDPWKGLRTPSKPNIADN